MVGFTISASLGCLGNRLVEMGLPALLAAVLSLSLALHLRTNSSLHLDGRICSTLTCILFSTYLGINLVGTFLWLSFGVIHQWMWDSHWILVQYVRDSTRMAFPCVGIHPPRCLRNHLSCRWSSISRSWCYHEHGMGVKTWIWFPF